MPAPSPVPLLTSSPCVCWEESECFVDSEQEEARAEEVKKHAKSMFDEMKTAALLAKGVSGDAAALPAMAALALATRDSARALGMEKRRGQLREGFDADLIAKYGGAGPRYTSYPTAVQFSDEFGPKAWLSALKDSNKLPIPADLSLYVHVPFCSSPCFYCGCNRIITRSVTAGQEFLVDCQRVLPGGMGTARCERCGGAMDDIAAPRRG